MASEPMTAAFLALASLAFRQGGLVQLRPKPIPPIDWNDLPYQETVRKMAQGWRAKYGLPGVWCAFVKDGKVVACVADGYKNLETKAPALVTDHLNVGSVSKVITGTLIAELVAMGVISYETTVGETFPELARKYPDASFTSASLRQLLAHTSGLPRDLAYWPDQYGGVSWRLGEAEVGFRVKDAHAPNTIYSYSNAGISIATAMVERAIAAKRLESQIGTSYEDWLTGSLGRAIGLTNPAMLSYVQPLTPADVQTHEFTEGGDVVASNPHHKFSYRYATQGSCSLTLTDICRFAVATLDNAPMLPSAEYRGVFERVSESLRSDTSASWHKATLGWLFHEGNTSRGEWAVMRIDPEKRTAFAFYTNVNFKSGAKIPPSSFGSSVQSDLNRLYRP